MGGDDSTLVDGVIARLVSRFAMEPVGPAGADPAIAADAYSNPRARLDLRFHRDLGTLHLRARPDAGRAWELTLRGIGSARNWFTAEIRAADELDRAAIDLLHEIDQTLDGMLRQGLLARQTLLARRRDLLVQMSRSILSEHAALQRLDHTLDRHARELDSAVSGNGQSRLAYLREQWLAIPEQLATTPWAERRRGSELAAAGSQSEGYRFYLECVMHGSSAEEAAQYLAGEIAAALHDGQLSASIEPIDPFGPFINDQLRAFFDVVLDARGDSGTRPVPPASSFQVAMERLGA